jgi:hypothetical protein
MFSAIRTPKACWVCSQGLSAKRGTPWKAVLTTPRTPSGPLAGGGFGAIEPGVARFARSPRAPRTPPACKIMLRQRETPH